jgi:uncharacterized protein
MNARKHQIDWPWHIGGFALGLTVIFAFVTARPVGTATVYEKVIGHVLQFFSPEYVARVPHYFEKATPVADWETMFVIGLVLAGLIGRYMFVRQKGDEVPSMWNKAFGERKGRRFVQAFLGGFLLLFGARLANGCTSGHFISGGSQLALSAYIFAGAIFTSGIITAKLLYRRREIV